MKKNLAIVLIGLSLNVVAQKDQKVLPGNIAVLDSNSVLTSAPLQLPIYKVYKMENKLIPDEYFTSISTKYFSFLAVGQDVTAPAVNNFSIDLLDAKFDIKGAVGIKNNKFLLNVGLSGDKEGNSVTLFEDKKTGGKFDAELKLSWSPLRKFRYTKEEKKRVWVKIREIDYKYYSKYLRDSLCPAPEYKEKCTAIAQNDFIKSFPSDSIAIKRQAIIDSAEAKQKAIFNSAHWNSIHMLWFTAKGKLGGENVYSVTQTLNYVNDSVKKNNLMTVYGGIEANYYYNSHKGLALFLNVGFGYERTNNIIDLDKISVTESVSMKDTNVIDPNSRKRDFSTKYDAFTGQIKTVENRLTYINIYSLFGTQQLFGLHFGLEYRDSKHSNSTAFITGLIANVPKKGDAKSAVSIEVFLKLNQVNKTTEIDFGNEHKSTIGLTFNIPIPSLPKS
ncbi:MAG: hypothetical protein JWO44_204 [Bacteroidetes bacterium]|nr:hypothetical protein [Bacteroidota bacterium]